MLCTISVYTDLQVCGVFRDVWRNTGQLQIGAVNHSAFAATFLRTYQVLEALPAQTTTIVLLTCRGKRKGTRQGEPHKTQRRGREGGSKEKPGKRRWWRREDRGRGTWFFRLDFMQSSNCELYLKSYFCRQAFNFWRTCSLFESDCSGNFCFKCCKT